MSKSHFPPFLSAALGSLLLEHFPKNFEMQRGLGVQQWDDQMLEMMAAEKIGWDEKIPRAAFRGRVRT